MHDKNKEIGTKNWHERVCFASTRLYFASQLLTLPDHF